MLSADLLERVRSRAADPGRRNDALDPTAENVYLGGAFKTERFTLGGEPPSEPAPLPLPATPETIAEAEATLGFALPDGLKQLWTEIADGGFGPGDGIAPVKGAVERYLRFLADPPGEPGRSWPQSLFPINLTEPGADCFELETGEIVFWDEESLADGTDVGAWTRSFRKEAASLGAWLEAWLARPSLEEQARDNMEQVMIDGLKSTLATWRAMTPEQRAEYGMPDEDGWEERLFGHLGVDLKSL